MKNKLYNLLFLLLFISNASYSLIVNKTVLKHPDFNEKIVIWGDIHARTKDQVVYDQLQISQYKAEINKLVSKNYSCGVECLPSAKRYIANKKLKSSQLPWLSYLAHKKKFTSCDCREGWFDRLVWFGIDLIKHFSKLIGQEPGIVFPDGLGHSCFFYDFKLILSQIYMQLYGDPRAVLANEQKFIKYADWVAEPI